jgi:hypothetical protein
MQTQIQATGLNDNAEFYLNLEQQERLALLDFLRCLRIKSATQKQLCSIYHLAGY